jgi:hypothetical protein
VNHDSTNVTDNFKHQTKDHSRHVSPGLVFDSKAELRDNVYSENPCVDGISRECW